VSPALPEFIGFHASAGTGAGISLAGIPWEPGDLAYYSSGVQSSSPPALVSGWDNVGTNAVGSGGNHNSQRVARRVLQAGDSSWNANGNAFLYVYRGGVHGASQGGTGTSSSVTIPNNTPLVGQLSRIAVFYYGADANNPSSMNPSGYVSGKVGLKGSGAGWTSGWESNGQREAFTGLTFSYGASSRRIIRFVEITAP
jgi:hypothetical protein